MPDRPFTHLHCHTHYSLLDGANRIPELVAHVASLGMNAVSITDHGNLYGAIEFYRECKTAGINPIIGYEAYVAPLKRTDRDARKRGDAGYHLTLLARNEVGFRNLIKMSSIAFLEGYHYVPRIDKDLLEAHSEGIVCLSGCASSEFSEFILKDQMDEATRVAEWFAKIFRNHFYVEIQNNGLDIQKLCAAGAIDIANKLGLPLVATSDAHYLTQSDSVPHDVLLCINTGRTIKDENRMRYGSDQFYIRPPEEMYRLFPEHAAAVKRSQEIADGCDIQLDFKKRHFPVFLPPDGKTPEDYLRELCAAGVMKRYNGKPSEVVLARLDHELGIICRMGFASYFLIVADFVRFAVENGIPCSARGSACGAIVSFVLELSHVDPLEYDLLFERFLDPNRSEAPDIDIDFCQERREEVIAYVRKKYGEASVAQIATFGTLAARAAIKDVGRVYDIPLQRVLQLTEMIPQRLGITLDEAIKENPDLKALYQDDVEVRRVLDIARRLEGTNRQCGIHAAGVVIANGPLTDYVPLHRAMRKGDDAGSKQGEAIVATQWVMGDLEKVGLLKMDFLGLRTLTLLTNAVGLIEKTHGIKIDLFNLPLDDRETYDLLQRGDAKGIFQLESDGIRELLKRLRPDNIRDIIALMALYRPGPLEGGMVDDYVNIKHGRARPSYAHPVMEEVLAETYGVMCIHEDARVSLADGTERPIKLINRGDRVHALNLNTRRFEFKEVEGCGPTRRGDGIRITLENGFSVLLTPDHDVWTFSGWKEVQELDPETDLIAIGLTLPQEVPTCTNLAPWLGADEDVAYLMGFLVGDGCLTGSGITIATGIEVAHQKVVDWLAARIPTLHVHSYFHVRSWYVNLSHPDLLGEAGHGNRKTRLHHFLGSHGLKVDALNKKVPESIFRCPAPVRAAFLAGLIDSDGCLAENNKGVGVAFITSSSPALLQGIRRLCQLEGVSLKLYAQRAQIWDLRTLHAVVSPYLVVKQFVGRLQRGATVGWLPRSAMGEMVHAGESIRAFAERTGIQRRGMGHGFPFIKSSTAAKAGIDLGDVRFYRVISAERVPDQQFYGMSVADHHNLVADGIVVKNCYQEQIMRILNRLGGIELASAYACIKAISKKKYDVIHERKVDFVNGARERGLERETAENIFELIVKFGGYGFNKSHSAAYALLGYQTAYLKRHFTAEFMAALLSSEIDDGNKRDIMVDHIADAKKLGVEVLPPDVNRSVTDFTVSEGKIVFGLAALKGCGRVATEGIVRAREEGGRFRDVFDFCERVDHRAVPRSAMERLIMAGAFDRLGGHRAQLMHVLTRALQAASERQSDKRVGQRNLFGEDLLDAGGATATLTETLPEVEPWPETEKLKREKEVLDFYLSSHPLAQREEEIRRYITHSIGDLKGVPANTEVTLGGMLTQLRIMTYKKPQRNGNTRYGRCKIEDFSGIIETLMWGDEFNKFKDAFIEDEVVIVRGNLERKTDEPVLQLTRLLTLEQAQKELASKLHLLFKLGTHSPVDIDVLGTILKKTPGSCPVILTIKDPGGKRCILQLGRDYHVNPSTYRRDELESLLGTGGVQLR